VFNPAYADSAAGQLNAPPEIVLIDPVTVSSGGNGSRDVRLIATETAENKTGCFVQIRLFSIVFHIFCPVLSSGQV
jgi:hypothetical protein